MQAFTETSLTRFAALKRHRTAINEVVNSRNSNSLSCEMLLATKGLAFMCNVDGEKKVSRLADGLLVVLNFASHQLHLEIMRSFHNPMWNTLR